jgi:RNA polymerase sigma-70 factor (ECF subfamily)
MNGRDEADRRRFEEVFTDHFDTVLRFTLRRAEPELARDAAAETFLAAWRARAALPAEPRAWLLAVARRKLADQYRARGRHEALALRLAAEPAPDAPDPAHQVPDRQLVAAAVARLSAADRELLQLLAWDGLTPAEAAEVLGCSRALVAVRLHRARHRLRAALAAESSEPTRSAEPPAGGPVRTPTHPVPVEEHR